MRNSLNSSLNDAPTRMIRESIARVPYRPSLTTPSCQDLAHLDSASPHHNGTSPEADELHFRLLLLALRSAQQLGRTLHSLRSEVLHIRVSRRVTHHDSHPQAKRSRSTRGLRMPHRRRNCRHSIFKERSAWSPPCRARCSTGVRPPFVDFGCASGKEGSLVSQAHVRHPFSYALDF